MKNSSTSIIHCHKKMYVQQVLYIYLTSFLEFWQFTAFTFKSFSNSHIQYIPDNSFIQSFILFNVPQIHKTNTNFRIWNMSRVYIRYIKYICLWSQTDSESYISGNGYSRGIETCITIYIGQPQFQTDRQKHNYKQWNLSDMNVSIQIE